MLNLIAMTIAGALGAGAELHPKDVTCEQIGVLQCGQTTTGRISNVDDCPLVINGSQDGTFVDRYRFSPAPGSPVTIDFMSSDFDPFLIVLGPDGSTLLTDDDSGAGTDARAEFVANSEGSYQLFANNIAAGVEGTYTLTLACQQGDSDFNVDASISGSWFDPSHDGEGWKMEILDNGVAVVYWFTYPPAGGTGEQAWIIGTGSVSGNQVIFDDAIITRGTSFGDDFDPSEVERNTWGDMVFTFDGPDSGSLSYAGPASFGSGSLDLVRLTNLTGINGGGNDNGNVGAGISGSWFDPTHDGEGWIIEVIDTDQALVYWFTYDDQDNQAWNLGIGTMTGNQISVDMPVDAFGTVFGPDFDPADVVRRPWGQYTFTFADCNSGVLDYVSSNGLGSGTNNIVRLTSLAGHVCSF